MTQPSARFGPYAVVSALGAGGMGEVYRATDTRLDRTVALKVLPQHVAASASRRQRFEREARAASRLSHPHICALYDVGEQDGVPFLVMEHLEGETLAQRLRRGPLALKEVLQYGIEIAGALAHAHRAGIVHRDLKPANIMLTASGAKLLDFGVAALRAPDAMLGGPHGQVTQTDSLTEEGTILGTMHYMAPEQLEGRDVDARADLFALGAVLYEMTTGEQAFTGASRASVIASILERDPPALAARAPSTAGVAHEDAASALLDHVVRRCLAKDPDARWQTAADLKRELEWIAGRTANVPATRAATRAPRRVGLWIAASLAGAVAIAAVVTFTMFRRSPEPGRPVRFVVAPPPGSAFSEPHAGFAISPDGRALVFMASTADGARAIWHQSLDSTVARRLAGTEEGMQPSWTLDSRSVVFSRVDSYKILQLPDGKPRTLFDSPGQTLTMNRDGVILLHRQRGERVLNRTSAEGAPIGLETALDPARGEITHNWPQFLPDGRHYIYSSRSGVAQHDGLIFVGTLGSKERTALLKADSHAVYAAPGYLLFMRGNTLFAQPFDAERLRLSGSPAVVAEDVDRNPGSYRGAFSVSQEGVLVYRSLGQTELAWFDRNGRPLGTLGPPAQYGNPALSPDGRRVAVDRLDPETRARDIWVIDVDSSASVRITRDAASEDMPFWHPDQTRVGFRRSSRDAGFVAASATGLGQETRLLPLAGGGAYAQPYGWLPDKRTLLYSLFAAETTRSDVWSAASGVQDTAVAVVRGPFDDIHATVSPDGRWLAYVSDESGRYDVYLRSFPDARDRWMISTAAGVEPAWRRDSAELFYLAADGNLMAVPVSGPSGRPRRPEKLFATRMATATTKGYTRNQYAVTADGQRFLINQPVGTGSSSVLTVIVNWPAIVK